MPMIAFLPWATFSSHISLGEIQLTPLGIKGAVPGLDKATASRVRNILAAYRAWPKKAIESVTIVHLKDKSIVADLSDDERELLFDAAEIVAFVALAGRTLAIDDSYVCRDQLDLVIQAFDLTDDGISVSARRRYGRERGLWTGGQAQFQSPVHVKPVTISDFETGLATALLVLRASDRERWVGYRDAISFFNRANTDSSSTSAHLEVVFLAAAIQRVVTQDGVYKELDLAQHFSALMAPKTPITVKDCDRVRAVFPKAQDKHLREVWIRDLEHLRNPHAHGKIEHRVPYHWTPWEHLLLGAYAFPLVVKARLAKEGSYTLTEEDQLKIDSFEQAVCTDNTKPVAKPRHSEDSPWYRFVEQMRKKIRSRVAKTAFDEALRRAEAELGPPPSEEDSAGAAE